MAVELLDNKETYNKMVAAKNPFGDGYAAERIVEAIRYYFGVREDRPLDY
jgi:UDP-N-acetylglucosamine 2-epimerase (non-hydrolysing)